MENESNNWTLFLTWFNFFEKKKNISKKLNPSHQHYSKNWTHFFEFDSKNWTFFDQNFDSKHVHSPKKKWLKEFNLFLNTTLGIDVFWVWLKDFFQKYDTKNCCFQMWLKKWTFFLNVARRISTLFYYDSENWTRFFFFFVITLSELNSFFNRTQRYCSLNMTQKIDFMNKNHRIELFFVWLQELFFFSKWLK